MIGWTPGISCLPPRGAAIFKHHQLPHGPPIPPCLICLHFISFPAPLHTHFPSSSPTSFPLVLLEIPLYLLPERPAQFLFINTCSSPSSISSPHHHQYYPRTSSTMLVCLVCPKETHLPPDHDDHHHPSLAKSPPQSKEHIKSFTTQLKDIVMKFSTGAYRHCRPPCTAQAGGGASQDQNEEDEKSAILVASNSEDQAFSDHQILPSPTHVHQFGDFSPTRYALLPTARRRHHHHKKKSSSTHSNQLLHDGNIIDPSSLLNIMSTPPIRTLSTTQQLSSDLHLPHPIEQQLNEQLSREQLLDEQLISKEQHLDQHDYDHENNSNNNNNDTAEAGKYDEWVAQVEPGVMITFVALPDGANHLKRIRFSREFFSKWQAQLWWAENSDMVHELYSVTRSEAPNCDSARSSSTTSSSTSRQENALRNTPEKLSSVGSGQSSPAATPSNAAALDLLLLSDNVGLSPKSGACTTASQRRPVNCVTEGGFAQIMDHYENHDQPDELLGHIENEGMESPLMGDSPKTSQGGLGLWASEDESLGVYVNLQQQREAIDDDAENAFAGGLRELKRVKFIKQPPN